MSLDNPSMSPDSNPCSTVVLWRPPPFSPPSDGSRDASETLARYEVIAQDATTHPYILLTANHQKLDASRRKMAPSPFTEITINQKLLQLISRPPPELDFPPGQPLLPVTIQEDEHQASSQPVPEPRKSTSRPPLTRKKIVLKRKTDVGDDVFGPDPSAEKRRKEGDGDEDGASSLEQWRVGKTPGHQGSHIRTPREPSSESSSPESISAKAGDKRSLHQVRPTLHRFAHAPSDCPSSCA